MLNYMEYRNTNNFYYHKFRKNVSTQRINYLDFLKDCLTFGSDREKFKTHHSLPPDGMPGYPCRDLL